ncbi:phage tail protein [Anaerocolumna chitinilytica]|uniref:Phage tail protein n=1 Tax=Anaerocolumna chitinilytica TaxID=1727145 RepID=A0A7I8DHZ1_9FIRM|nr:phage tail protein [Anaerocolumna chitinilytica]BCJ98118.1 hypothetical protein bsdcttw_11590 [Anaerocolumna chitinilytica]
MKIGTFGSKVFSVSDNKINTFGNISRSANYNTEEQENGGSKPRLKNKAPELESMSFEISLRSDFSNVRREIDEWIQMKGKAYFFIIGKETYGLNKWELVGVEISNQEFAAGGILKKATLSLSFKESITSKKANTAKQTRNTKGG